MDKLPIVERLRETEPGEFSGFEPYNRDGEEAADLIEELVAALESYACDCDTSFPKDITECNGYFDAAYCGKRAVAALSKAKRREAGNSP